MVKNDLYERYNFKSKPQKIELETTKYILKRNMDTSIGTWGRKKILSFSSYFFVFKSTNLIWNKKSDRNKTIFWVFNFIWLFTFFLLFIIDYIRKCIHNYNTNWVHAYYFFKKKTYYVPEKRNCSVSWLQDTAPLICYRCTTILYFKH